MKQNVNDYIETLAVWNERDLTRIRKHIDETIAENVIFADPNNFIHGRDAFEEMVKEFRLKYPEAVVKRTSGIDSHNHRSRYSWGIYGGGILVLEGTDVVQLNEKGLVERIDGFFGDLPPMDS
jgi:hypothetical protein